MTVKICRVCFEEGDDLESLGSGTNSYGHKLASCVPEIDVYVVCNPSICSTCLPMVEVAYALRETCIENERKFRTKKVNAIRGKCEVQTAKRNPETEKPETVITEHVDAIENNQIHVSVIFNNCFNESCVPPVTIKEEITLTDDFDSPKSACATNLDEGRSKDEVLGQNLRETFKSEDELISSLNEMCADLKNLGEITRASDAGETSAQLFSDGESEASFELDLDSLNLFSEDEMKKSQGETKNERMKVNKIVSCKVCKEMHDENYISAHMKTHDVRSTYDCGRCDKTFSDTCELESHSLTHLKNLCDICGNVFKSKSDLVEHKRTHVTVCCGEEFSTGSLLQLHAYQKHGKTCGICKKTCDSFNVLFLHMLEHMGEDKLRCCKCKKTFSSDTLKLGHRCESHDGDQEQDRGVKKNQQRKKFQCKYCQSRFKKRRTYVLHLRHHQRKGNFECDRCTASFALKSELEKHLSEEHGPIKQHESDVNIPEVLNGNCGALSFSREQSAGTDSIETNWNMCQLCPGKFQDPSLLTQHLLRDHCVKTASIELVDYQKSNLVETPVRLHCYACQEVYMNVNLYLKHMKLFHSKCTVCNLRLNDVRNVIEHVQRHYKNKKEDCKLSQTHLSVKSELPYCELCQTEFPDKSCYNVHMDKFHKKGFRYSTKLYSCKICYDVFDTKRELREHGQEHYVCVHCKKTFALKASLRQHVIFYHNNSSKSTASAALNQRKRAPYRRLTLNSQASSYSVSQKQIVRFHKTCKTCGEVFSNTKFLMRHIYAVHSRCTIECGMENGSEDENVMVPALSASCCDICQEQFDTVDKLKVHVSVHI